jgi:hypothetical protein
MKVLKWIGIILGVLIGLIVVIGLIAYNLGSAKLTQVHEYTPENIAVPTDAESVANGKYLVEHFMLCADCHGGNLAGMEFINDPSFAVLYTPNLTSGQGGIGSTYTDADWVRALRHGIRPNGEVLLIMPSELYTFVDAGELGDMIAYLKTLPAVDNEIPARQIAAVPRVLLGLGIIPAGELLPAMKIDHNAPPLTAPARGVTVEYGDYRAGTCKGCHGLNMAGAPADPQAGFPAAPNLTLGGELIGWTEADFLTTLTTGVTPSGNELDPIAMPWPAIGTADQGDLRAIWLYIQSLPATPTNQ